MQPSSRYFSKHQREDNSKLKHEILLSDLIDILTVSSLMYFYVNCFLSTFSVANQYAEEAAFERFASKGASENLNHPYGNLRLMNSMDTTTENKTTIRCENDELSSDNNVGVTYGLISKRQLKDACFTDTNREGRRSNNYEQPFQTSSEYSILSLKRNIDLSTTDLYV